VKRASLCGSSQRQVQVRGDAGREAQEGEDDVLDALRV
jgi:hypothetical protein